jgi:hypothetical protein
MKKIGVLAGSEICSSVDGRFRSSTFALPSTLDEYAIQGSSIASSNYLLGANLVVTW